MEHITYNLKQELLQEYINILDFWSRRYPPNPNEGFPGEINRAGNPVKGADKGVVLNTRLLWTFASAYNFLKNEKYLELATRTYEYLISRFWDHTHGGLFWKVNHEGEMVDGRKQIYAQGFGIYGFTEFYLASGRPDSLEYAVELFNLVERHSRDFDKGGYIEACSRNWGPCFDMRLSKKDMNEPKSMNTHLHVIEPYTTLYRAWPNNNLAAAIEQLLQLFLNRIVNKQTSHLNLFFREDWSVKSTMVSYGHDIECAWLLCEAAEALGDEKLIEAARQRAVQLTDAVLREGVGTDGSISYEKDPDAGLEINEKHWWVQAEALVGFINAFQITGNPVYLGKMKNTWTFIKRKMIDHQQGEWFLRLDAQGLPVLEDPKAGFWKCPYHNTRALMETYSRLNMIETNLNVPHFEPNPKQSITTEK